MRRSVPALCCLLLLLTILVLIPAGSSQTTQIYINPYLTTVSVNNEFTVEMRVSDVVNLWMWEAHLSFDPSLMECLSTMEGPFLHQPPLHDPLWFSSIDNMAGDISMSEALINPPPASGSGILAYITFRCKGEGTSVLDLHDSQMATPDAVPIVHLIEDGWVIQITQGTGPITVPDDYPTIQEAINYANSGDTIFVKSGAYSVDEILVNKSLTINGESRDSTTLNGTSEGPIMVVESDNVTISNLTFVGWVSSDITLNQTTGVVVTRNRMVFNGVGVDVEYSTNATVENNMIEGNGLDNIGIMLAYSSECTIKENTISNAIYDGIRIWDSDSNLVQNNTITGNDFGIWLYESSGNTIRENTISENHAAGIEVGGTGNLIFHNNFLENYMHVFPEYISNSWDGGYPIAGNYWSDFNPTDEYQGPYQNVTGRDAIGDQPYVIDSSNVDHYPLIYPFGYVPSPDLNQDGIVDIIDIVRIAVAYGSFPGLPIWSPYADLNQDGVIDIIDIVLIAARFGQTI